MPNVKFIRDTLYQMKKDYGVPVKYGRLVKNELNLDTGINTVTKEVYLIRKAVLLPTKLMRKFVQDIAYLAANKNFTYGALFDEKLSLLIIDSRDLPRGLQLNMDDFLFMGHQRFMIKQAEILEHNCGWLITAQTHEGAHPFEIQPASCISRLGFQQEVTYVRLPA
jgi:hypothetical protein